ncbi:MAG TPA: hypothetical protein VIY48_17855 [Candidatus Paceibacterota bacterium]
MLALLGLIPGVLSLIQFVTGKVFDAKVAIIQARTGANRDVAVELVKAAVQQEHENSTKLSVIASNPLLTFMLFGFATPFVIYIWKIVVVDIVIGPGCIWFTSMCWVANTDPIRGQVSDWGNTIIAFLFGSATTVALGKMWFGRDKTGE